MRAEGSLGPDRGDGPVVAAAEHPPEDAPGPGSGPRTPMKARASGGRAVLEPREEPARLPWRLACAAGASRPSTPASSRWSRSSGSSSPSSCARCWSTTAVPTAYGVRRVGGVGCGGAGGVGAHRRVDLVERPAHRLVLGLERVDQRRVDPEVDRDREQDRVLLLVVVPELVAQVAPGAAEVGRASSVAVGDLVQRAAEPGQVSPHRGVDHLVHRVHGHPQRLDPAIARPRRDRRTPLRWWSTAMRSALMPHGSVTAMADRPRGNGGPEEGTPEYNWLYGNKGALLAGGPDATRAVPQQPRPDETRVMPASADGGRPPRPRAAPAGRRHPRSPRRRAPAAARAAAPAFPGFRLRWIWLLLLLWVVYLVAVPLYAWTKVEKVAFEPERRPARRPAGHDVPAGRQRLARRPAARRSARSSAPATPPGSAPTRSCCCTPATAPTC